MKIAVFGGSFDPPHLGHLSVAEHLLTHDLADDVWFLPVKKHAFGKYVSLDDHRLTMLHALIEGKEHMHIATHELENEDTSYTYQTLLELKKQFPDHIFTFVMGADNLLDFTKWYQYEKLLADFSIWVFPRVGYQLSPLQPEMSVIKNMEPIEVSSTQIKKLLSNGQPVNHLVPKAIAEYISQFMLYSNV